MIPKSDLLKQYARQFPGAIDATLVFGSRPEAEQYALTDPTAYPGQMLAYLSEQEQKPAIVQPDKSLKDIGGEVVQAGDLASQQSSFGQALRHGTSLTFARSDHYHALPNSPASPNPGNLTSQQASFGQALRNGTSTNFARSDHYHALPPLPAIPAIRSGTWTITQEGVSTPGAEVSGKGYWYKIDKIVFYTASVYPTVLDYPAACFRGLPDEHCFADTDRSFAVSVSKPNYGGNEIIDGNFFSYMFMFTLKNFQPVPYGSPFYISGYIESVV